MSNEEIHIREVIPGLTKNEAQMVTKYLRSQNADDRQLFFERVSVETLDDGRLLIEGTPSKLASRDLALKSIRDAVSTAMFLAA